MTDVPSARDTLQRGRLDSGLGIEDLWLHCLGMGFNAPMRRLQAIFDGTRQPSRGEYDVIAQCLNERLKDLGVAVLVPYGDEIGM